MQLISSTGKTTTLALLASITLQEQKLGIRDLTGKQQKLKKLSTINHMNPQLNQINISKL
jgi:hypothetical protein